jgi:DNA topoisomerase-1
LSSSGIEEKTIQERTGVERKKLFPTDIGFVVNDFLTEHFKQVMDYNFTAEVEKEFDEISNGNKPWNEMISVFYGPFHKNVEDTLENSERASGMTLLGVDPKSGYRRRKVWSFCATQKQVYLNRERARPYYHNS